MRRRISEWKTVGMNQHWRYFSEYGEDKSNIHDLRWDVYTRDNEELINRYVYMSVIHSKGVGIVWNCVKYRIIEKIMTTKLLDDTNLVVYYFRKNSVGGFKRDQKGILI